MAQRQDDRLARHAPRQLRERDDRAGEGDGADGDAERHLDQARDVRWRRARRCRRLRAHRARRRATNTAARPTSEWNAATSSGIAVIGIRRAVTAPMPPPRPRPPAIRHQVSGIAGRDGERRHHGDGHADHAGGVATPRGCRARQAAQRQDEQHAGDEIERRDEIGRHGSLPPARSTVACSPLRRSFFLYMASMRCVTRKPPKMLTEAMASARKPKIFERRCRESRSSHAACSTATASSAPTTITEEMALVTVISGVCSAGVTLHTT